MMRLLTIDGTNGIKETFCCVYYGFYFLFFVPCDLRPVHTWIDVDECGAKRGVAIPYCTFTRNIVKDYIYMRTILI